MAVLIYSLLFFSIFFTSMAQIQSSSNNVGITTELFHRDLLSDSSETPFRRLRRAFDRSFARKSSMRSFGDPISPAGGEYIMKIMIGTPPVEQLLIADTGSDILWTQCKPCIECYNQTLPLFDPSRTSSYETVSCDSDQCKASESSTCGRRDTCRYEVNYGDSSHSNGELAVETLTFDGGVSFPNVAFGCAHDSAGTFSPDASGIIGLGGGSVSIINQLESSISGKFSYCMTLPGSNSSSKISFGSDAVVEGDEVVVTPLVDKSPATFYHLTLEGFSVGKRRVNYYNYSCDNPSGLGDGEEGNIIIDSGTTLTFVPAEMYGGLEAALKETIKGRRASDSRGRFRLCYRVKSGGGIRAPPVTAHFRGADVVLPKENVFVEVEEGIACLTLVPSEGTAIFGNLHQMNYHVGYDLAEKKVSFKKTDCSKQDSHEN